MSGLIAPVMASLVGLFMIMNPASSSFQLDAEHVAYGSSVETIWQVPGPSLHNLAGEKITALEIGQQAVIRYSAHSLTEQSFVIVIEIRDGNGFTEFLAWQSGMAQADSDFEMQFSWSPRDYCTFYEECEKREIRSFALSSIDEPRALSTISTTSRITIVGVSAKSPVIEHYYKLTVNDQEYEIGYSFNKGNGQIIGIDVDPDAKIMRFALETLRDSQFTIMMPMPLFDYTLVGNTQTGVAQYVQVDGNDRPFDMLIDFEKHTVTYVVAIEQGTEEVRLQGIPN